MKNYYVELSLEPSASASAISDQLASLRKKWNQRAGIAATQEARSEADFKVKLIYEALRIFADEDSRRQYDVELNNQEEVVRYSSQEVIDEVYDKKLARVNEYFEEKDYKTASDRAKDMLAEGYKTADVYENAMLGLYNIGSQYDDQIQKLGDDAIDIDGITDSRIYRVYVFATERKNNYSLARRRLVELKKLRPNETSVDYLIASMFMNHFGGEFFIEARSYIDSLIQSKRYDDSVEVAKWDIICELKQHRLQMVIPKIAKYFTDSRYSDNKTHSELVKILAELHEEYLLANYENVTAYIAKVDASILEDNMTVCRYIPSWDVLFTLENTKNITIDWYEMVEKYKAQSLSVACYEMFKKQASKVAGALPSYKQALSIGKTTLADANNADYNNISKLLGVLNEIRKQARTSDGDIDDMIAEVESIRTLVHTKIEIKPLKLIRLVFRAAFWILLIPLCGVLINFLITEYAGGDTDFWRGESFDLSEFFPLLIAGGYLSFFSYYATFGIWRALSKVEYKGLKGTIYLLLLVYAGVVFIFALMFLPLAAAVAGIIAYLELGYPLALDFNEKLVGFAQFYDRCYSIVSFQPIVFSGVALVLFILLLSFGSKIRKRQNIINKAAVGTTLMSWVR